MMIKCKNCQSDNQLGSIFCRSCGTKLDLEDIGKNIKGHLYHKKNIHLFLSLVRIVLVIFFITSLYGAYLILEPGRYFRSDPHLTQSQEISTMELYNKIDTGTAGTYRFTSAQLSYLMTRIFSKRGNPVTVSFPENKYFGFTITKNLIDYSYLKLNVRITAVCNLLIERDERRKNILTANLKYLKLGELKLPTWYNQLFIDDFMIYAASRKLEGYLRKIDRIKIEHEQIELVLDKR